MTTPTEERIEESPDRTSGDRPGVGRRPLLKALSAGAALSVGSGVATASDDEDDDDAQRAGDGEVVTQTADVVGQGAEGDLAAEGGATIHRTSNEILVEVSMPMPTPGEYTYPSEPEDKKGEWWTDEAGELEAFSLWAFTFNNPEECEDDCGSDDLGDPAGGGAFGVTGYVSDGGDLTLNGYVSTDTEPFEMGGDPLGVPLARPLEAEVHLAVAPHGAFDPEMMPEQLGTPASPSDVWWIALFDPPA